MITEKDESPMKIAEEKDLIQNHDEGALKEIAASALKRGSGARGLRSIIEDLTMDLMYDLPEQTNLRQVIIDEAVVRKEKLPMRLYGQADQKSA